MPHVSFAALIVVLTLVAVLATSGAAKLRDRRATRDAFDALRVPGIVPADSAAAALPWVEIALAVLLLVAPGGWLVPVAVALVLLMLAYTWIIARALGFDEPVTCSCFGSLGRHDVDRTTLLRNLLLTVLAAAVLWFALAGGSVPGAVGDLDGGDWWALVATIAAVAVAVLVLGRVSSSTGAPADHEELLDYARQPIPYGAVSRTDGTTASLTELARTQARLLVVLNRNCGPCVRTAREARRRGRSGWPRPSASSLSIPTSRRPPSPTSTPRSSACGSRSTTYAACSRSPHPRRSCSARTDSWPAARWSGEDDVDEFVSAVIDQLAMQQETSG